MESSAHPLIGQSEKRCRCSRSRSRRLTPTKANRAACPGARRGQSTSRVECVAIAISIELLLEHLEQDRHARPRLARPTPRHPPLGRGTRHDHLLSRAARLVPILSLKTNHQAGDEPPTGPQNPATGRLQGGCPAATRPLPATAAEHPAFGMSADSRTLGMRART